MADTPVPAPVNPNQNQLADPTPAKPAPNQHALEGSAPNQPAPANPAGPDVSVPNLPVATCSCNPSDNTPTCTTLVSFQA